MKSETKWIGQRYDEPEEYRRTLDCMMNHWYELQSRGV